MDKLGKERGCPAPSDLCHGKLITLLKDRLSSKHFKLRTKLKIFSRKVAVTIETATTVEPYLAPTIKPWPAKYGMLTIETENKFSKLKPSLSSLL